MTLLRRASWARVALALGATALVGCAGTPHPLAPAAATTHPVHSPLSSREVEVDVSTEAVAFTGDLATASVGAVDATLAQATVGFGDGSDEVVTHSCARPAPALTAGHVYHQAGTFTITVTAARFCEPGVSSSFVAQTGPPLVVLPSASAASLSWPPCTQGQVQISVGPGNAAIGQLALKFTIRNISGTDCAIFGYPGLVLVSPDGSVLQSNEQRGGDGGMFPAIPPHLVALAAGGAASFYVGYATTAMYQSPSAPCGTAQDKARTFLPGSYSYTLVGPAGLYIIACGDDFTISPVFPGLGLY